MNWGLKIIVGLGAFMIFIVGAGIYMVSKDTDSLEEADYYEQSLSYDDVYDSKKNLLSDHATPTVRVASDTLYIDFQKEGNKGDLIFKRPSDGKLDVTLPFVSTNKQFRLPVSTFAKGNWHLEIKWKSGGTPYISDHILNL